MAEKREKYCGRFRKAIDARKLSSTEACKLAGMMQWAQSLQYGRVGRAYLWAIYHRANHEHNLIHVNEALLTALRGCLVLLMHAPGVKLASETWDMQEPVLPYVDAAGQPGTLAGVLLIDGRWQYFATTARADWPV